MLGGARRGSSHPKNALKKNAARRARSNASEHAPDAKISSILASNLSYVTNAVGSSSIMSGRISFTIARSVGYAPR